ncbi:ankyrin repeat-containing domain protein [Fusarium oxysporum f. sp. albedinis]|nr:ankyrin repeat-containing domain protein [Fusarium oxysporum f. sp. albedinis]
MDPVSIATTIFTLGAVVAELKKIGTRYANASLTLGLIQHDCSQLHIILHDFEALLQRRRNTVSSVEDEVNFRRLESLLTDTCNDITKDIDKLHNQLQTISTSKTQGEFLVNHVKVYLKLRSLQQAHAAIKEKLRNFQVQKSSWDSRVRETNTSHTQLREPKNTCTGSSSSSSLHSALAILDPQVRTSNREAIQKILRYSGIEVNNLSTFEGNVPVIPLAVSVGRIDVIELLLRHKADISSQNSEGLTALHIASMSKADDMVEFLLQHGADPQIADNDGHTPLWYGACGKCSDRSFQNLLRAHNRVGIDEPHGVSDVKMPTPLWAAAAGGYVDRAANLLDQGAAVDIRDKSGRTLLHRTEWPKSASLTGILLEHGANPWARDSQEQKLPLHRAAEQGRRDIAVKLLDKMIERQMCSRAEAANAQDKQGFTPLICAALSGFLPLVVHLFRVWDADITLRDIHGNDAFYWACAKGHNTVAVYLLGLGASISRGNKEGNTPLHIAAAHGHEETVRLLLSLCADTKARSRTIRGTWILHGRKESHGLPQSVTPSEAAKLAGHENIAELIDSFQQDD